jgi:hypothetical protein
MAILAYNSQTNIRQLSKEEREEEKRGRTILRRHHHNIPDIIPRIRTKDLPETLRALFALCAETRPVAFGLLAVPDEIDSRFSGGECAER